MDKKARWTWAGWAALALLCCADPAWAGPLRPKNPAAGLANLIGLGIGLGAFIVWGRATFPELRAKADRVLREHSAWKTFWVGLVNAAVVLLVAVFLIKVAQAGAKPVAALAAALLAGAAAVAFRGAMAVWPEYGHRVLGADEAPTDLQATLAGGGLLCGLLLLFPVGLLFFAYVLLRSMGTGILIWTQPKEAPVSDTAS